MGIKIENAVGGSITLKVDPVVTSDEEFILPVGELLLKTDCYLKSETYSADEIDSNFQPFTMDVAETLLTLENSWVDYEGSFSAPAYSKTAGIVTVSGLVKNGSNPGVIATLPAGCRPSKTLIIAVVSASVLGRMDIREDGAIYCDFGNSAWFSICCTFATA